MEIIRTVADMKARAAAWKAEGLSIGLVPTKEFIRFSYRKEGGNQSKYLPLRANLQIKI